MCARSKDKRRHEKEDGTGTKMCVAATKEKPDAQGQPTNPTSLSRPGRPKTWVEGKLCAKILRAKPLCTQEKGVK